MSVITKPLFVYDQFGRTHLLRRQSDSATEIHFAAKYADATIVNMSSPGAWTGVANIEDRLGTVVAADKAIVLVTAASGLFKIVMTSTINQELHPGGGIYTLRFRFDPDGGATYNIRAVNNIVMEIRAN